MNLLSRLFIYFICVFSVINAFADNPYKNIFNLNYTDISKELAIQEKSTKTTYFEALNEFVYYISTGDTTIANTFIQSYSNRNQFLKNNESYESKAIESELDFMLSLIHFSQNKYLKSAIPAYKAYRINKKLMQDYPDEKLHLKISGLILIASTVIPKEYKWLFNFTGLNGDLDTGFEYLRTSKLAEQESFNSNIVGTILISLVQGNILNDFEKANEELDTFENENQITIFLKARNLTKLGKNDAAIELLQDYIDNTKEVNLKYLYYQLGSAQLNKLDPMANVYLTRYLNESAYEMFKRTVCLKLAWYYRIFENEQRFDECNEKFYSYTLGLNETDKQATLEMEQLKYYNTDMIKSRLLFDGGYYNSSLNIINEIDIEELSTPAEKIEYLYRNARLFHKLEKLDLAETYYKHTIDLGHQLPLYFAAHAALQLGIIYEDQQKFENSQYYYKYCLSINKNLYKNSIEYKAKAGLDRIKKSS